MFINLQYHTVLYCSLFDSWIELNSIFVSTDCSCFLMLVWVMIIFIRSETNKMCSSPYSDSAFSCDGSQAAVHCLKLLHLSFLSFSVGNQMRNLVFTPRPSTGYLAVPKAMAS